MNNFEKFREFGEKAAKPRNFLPLK